MSRPSRIYYIARTLPSYRIAALKRLDERLGGRLVVCYGNPPGGSSLGSIAASSEGDLPTVRLRNYWIAGERLHFQSPWPAFRRFGRPAAILAEESPRSLSLPLLLAGARITRTPIALWGHFSSNNRAFSMTNWEDRIRIRCARAATACVCYTESIAELLRPFVPQRRIFVARNTLDTDTLFDLREALDGEGRPSVRERLGLPREADVLVFLGRLIEEKGTRILLDLVERLQKTRPIALVVIGDGPERNDMERRVRASRIANVIFTGALASLPDSAPWLYASDLMVLPGYVGLAVNHAFSLGLPVVTHGSPGAMRYHSPEFSYILDGENGLVAQHANLDALAGAVEHVLRDREIFADNALRYARQHLTLDRMVDGLEASVRFMEEERGGGFPSANGGGL